MASSVIHYAITDELIRRRQFKDSLRLKLGSVLPDAGVGGNSHMKITIDDGHRKTYDFEGYRKMFGDLMKEDDLYLGYYLHLIQDVVFRHFVYDKHHWNPNIPGAVDRLHGDYAIGNRYLVKKYGLKNELIIPDGFGDEPINRICAFDTDWLVKSIDM